MMSWSSLGPLGGGLLVSFWVPRIRCYPYNTSGVATHVVYVVGRSRKMRDDNDVAPTKVCQEV